MRNIKSIFLKNKAIILYFLILIGFVGIIDAYLTKEVKKSRAEIHDRLQNEFLYRNTSLTDGFPNLKIIKVLEVDDSGERRLGYAYGDKNPDTCDIIMYEKGNDDCFTVTQIDLYCFKPQNFNYLIFDESEYEVEIECLLDHYNVDFIISDDLGYKKLVNLDYSSYFDEIKTKYHSMVYYSNDVKNDLNLVPSINEKIIIRDCYFLCQKKQVGIYAASENTKKIKRDAALMLICAIIIDFLLIKIIRKKYRNRKLLLKGTIKTSIY